MPLLRFIPETANVDFVKYRWWAFGIDGFLMVASVVSFLVLGFNLGLDFTGGVEMEVRAKQTINIGQLRAQVEALNFGHPTVTTIGGGACNTPIDSCAVIRIAPRDAGPSASRPAGGCGRCSKQLGAAYTYARTDLSSAQGFGRIVPRRRARHHPGRHLMISVWVWFRFEWQYGVGALIATGHDVLVVAGFYSVFQWEFNLNTVAALLLLAGYSINDTGGGVRPHPREPAQIQAHEPARPDQPVHQPYRHPHHFGLGGHRLVGGAAAVRRPGAAEFQPRHPAAASWSALSPRPMSPRRCCSTCRRSAARASSREGRKKLRLGKRPSPQAAS